MKTLLSIIVVAISFTGISQSHYLGIKGGINWCNQSGDLFKNTKGLTRFSAGLDYGFKFKNNLKIGGNILYSETGFKYKTIFTDDYGNPITNGISYSDFHFNYLSIPIKVGYEYGNKMFVYGNIGFSTSFLLFSMISSPVLNANLEEIDRDNADITSIVAPIELAGIIEIGFGYTFFEKLGVFIEGNFQHGFTTLTTNEFFSGNTILNYKTSASIGIRYKLNK